MKYKKNNVKIHIEEVGPLSLWFSDRILLLFLIWKQRFYCFLRSRKLLGKFKNDVSKAPTLMNL